MPRNGNYAKAHTKQWASQVFESDAIVVVTPQYNRSFPAPIKNAIDYLFAEWDAKPVALVGYGWTGATDATGDLAKVLGHVKADVVGATGLVFTRTSPPRACSTSPPSAAPSSTPCSKPWPHGSTSLSPPPRADRHHRLPRARSALGARPCLRPDSRVLGCLLCGSSGVRPRLTSSVLR